ncbi:hypothetical protein WJX74_011042 [Apatococcus lobatus]|uniref:Large ribosomal subunit protein uL11m n=1 Tax=Apatococcus lobatus TaxID=904363 RepID=A0AAW1RU85_9CHLO
MSKPKAVRAVISLTIQAGQAKPSPPVGPALGQAGLNIMAFCKDFNAKTADLKDDVPVPVKITAYTDKSFIYTTKTPPISYFLKKAAGLEGGAKRPGHESAGTVTAKHIYEIAKIKQEDMQELPLQSICKSIAGSCRSMGIRVVGKME